MLQGKGRRKNLSCSLFFVATLKGGLPANAFMLRLKFFDWGGWRAQKRKARGLAARLAEAGGACVQMCTYFAVPRGDCV